MYMGGKNAPLTPMLSVLILLKQEAKSQIPDQTQYRYLAS